MSPACDGEPPREPAADLASGGACETVVGSSQAPRQNWASDARHRNKDPQDSVVLDPEKQKQARDLIQAEFP